MITAETACKNALEFIRVDKNWAVKKMFETGDMYILSLQDKRHDCKLMPVAVQKENGTCWTYYLDKNGWDKIQSAKEIEIPERYRL